MLQEYALTEDTLEEGGILMASAAANENCEKFLKEKIFRQVETDWSHEDHLVLRRFVEVASRQYRVSRAMEERWQGYLQKVLTANELLERVRYSRGCYR